MYIKPKKSLGQHFLTDANIQRKIINSCALKTSDTVLEIGAGKGQLTRLIAPRVKTLFALELDSRLCEFMKDEFKAASNMRIINQDILKLDLNKYFKKDKVKIIGNIPYYLSSRLIERLVRFKSYIDTVFITVQKEFAERLVACPGSKDYGSLSCFTQYYFNPRIIFCIKKTCFSPQPKVDSSFLRLDVQYKNIFDKKEEVVLFKIIRKAFAQRRKTLRNSLKDYMPHDKLFRFFSQYNIDSNIRPEDLSLADFINLTLLSKV